MIPLAVRYQLELYTDATGMRRSFDGLSGLIVSVLGRDPRMAALEWRESLAPSLIGKAINYTGGMWPRLVRYITDGCYKIDNNLIENTIRPIAMARKNYLFAGSHQTAQNDALIYSLVVTAKHHEVNPAECLEFVLRNISDSPFSRSTDLLPRNCKTTS